MTTDMIAELEAKIEKLNNDKNVLIESDPTEVYLAMLKTIS